MLSASGRVAGVGGHSVVHGVLSILVWSDRAVLSSPASFVVSLYPYLSKGQEARPNMESTKGVKHRTYTTGGRFRPHSCYSTGARAFFDIHIEYAV